MTSTQLSRETVAACQHVATSVARHLCRRRPWLAPEDVQQECWAAMLPKLVDYNASAGPLTAYLYRIALIAGKRLAIRLGAVASVPRREAVRGEVARQRAACVDAAALAAAPADEAPADEALALAEERAQLARLVASHLAAGSEGEAIRAVLSGTLRSAEAAAKYEVRVEWLYQATAAAKKSMRGDTRLQELAS